MGLNLKKLLDQAVAQVNPFDGGRTAQTVSAQYSKPAPAQTVSKGGLSVGVARPGSIKVEQPQPVYKMSVATAPTQNLRVGNTAIRNTTSVNPAAPPPVVQQPLTRPNPIVTKLATPGLGIVRSATGMAQGLSGLYDLATPGTGTNRFSKGLNTAAVNTDTIIRQNGMNQAAYKGGQLLGEVAGFQGAAKLGTKALGAAPGVVQRGFGAVDDFGARAAQALPNNAVGRIAGAGVRGGLSPGGQIANAAYTTRLIGEDASKGREITPGRVATDVALGAAMNFGVPAAGRALVEGGRGAQATTRLVKQGIDNRVPLDEGGFVGAASQAPTAAPALPTRNTQMVSPIDKFARSTRSIIERQGEHGQQLAGMLHASRDAQEIWLGKLQQAMPNVTKLARKGKNALVNKDFENFVDATQGLAKPANATVAKAVKEWQAVHPTIRQRAVAAGLDVGDLGPQYYPHFIDYDQLFKDKNTYNQAINHLVKTGQAPSAEEAIRMLNYAKDVSRNRSFGNLEAAREIDLPFYDKTPNSLISYLSGSTKRVANTETFGAGDEEALKLIAKAGQQGYDTEAMKDAFNVAAGAKNYNPTTSKISSGIRKYTTTTRLGLGALTNVSQNVNTGIVTGHLRTMGSALKLLDKKQRQFVADTGVISDALLNDLRTQQGYSTYSSKVAGKIINKVTAPGFGTVEKANRSIAAVAGRDYGLRLAQKGDTETLRKLGVTGDIKNKTLTDAQQVQVARKVVEKTQFKVDPQDLPGWTDSPGGRLVSQFRTFSYNQGKFFSNEILKPAAKGDLLPLGRVLAALPVGYGLYETRRVIDGRPEEENKTKVGIESFSKIGGAGLVLDLYRGINPVGSKYIPADRRTAMAAGTLGGPTVGTATQGVGALSELLQRKNTPKDETRLDGKLALAKGEEYTDATPAARFALQQIPIVGTPIKNRVLPYKKESEAQTGKAASADPEKQRDADIRALYKRLGDKAKPRLYNGTLYYRAKDGSVRTVTADVLKERLAKEEVKKQKAAAKGKRATGRRGGSRRNVATFKLSELLGTDMEVNKSLRKLLKEAKL